MEYLVAENFDSFSKHLAGKQTRRGALKLLGATLVGGIASAFVSRQITDATPSFNGCFNGTITADLVCFNETNPGQEREPFNFFAPKPRRRFNFNAM